MKILSKSLISFVVIHDYKIIRLLEREREKNPIEWMSILGRAGSAGNLIANCVPVK